MDLTPDELRKVTFKGATFAKGYSIPEVDEFVEQVATGIGTLLDQLRSAGDRANRAETALAEAKTSDETVQRTLVHAQKLADAVLAEARREASSVAAEAAEQASRLRAKARDEGAAHVAKAREARAEAERLRAETAADRARSRAEVDALLSRASEGIDADVRAEVERLHGLRSTLESDVATLVSWLEAQRAELRTVLAAALQAVETSALPIAAPPEVEPVDTTPKLLQGLVEASGDAGQEPQVVPTSADDDDVERGPASDGDAERPTAAVASVPHGDEAFAPEPRPRTSRDDQDLLAELRAARRSDAEPPLPGDTAPTGER